MIIHAPKNVEWSSDDAARLGEFINSPTGQRVLQTWAIGLPALLDGSHKTKTLVASGKHEGYQEAIDVFLRLTYENPNEPIVPETSSTNYPSPDDDSAWVEEDKAALDKSPK